MADVRQRRADHGTIRQMLRLARDDISAQEVGRTLEAARSAIRDNLGRAAEVGVIWPLPTRLIDAVVDYLTVRGPPEYLKMCCQQQIDSPCGQHNPTSGFDSA